MDLSQYFKKSRAGHSRFNTQLQKFCQECGKELANDGSIFYRQSFCSEKCKQAYINTGK